ncbi:tryptophan ABC transporter substrate-binding protein [Isobaculum melis]|uniref:Putative ABC transport system substrate-binding protein n=1 Tax=Isobaculum melis TaxID=142588 RepID=A0A1H9T0F2_9LACT|nr:tryptophan ABC transporter substrate-binding protein [Isobaculum melis]SER90611.1 putative ABC transport system substrate-binding protein [Isobaculum melis]
MKKMYGFIAGLVILLIIAFVTENNKMDQEQKENDIPKVGILQLMSHPSLDEIYQGFIAGMEEEGLVDGKTVHLTLQNAQGDQSNLKTMSEQFSQEPVDAMVGIATPSAQALANASKNIPIILGAVSDPEGAGLVTNNQTPGGNITGVSDLTPIKEQIELLKQLMPAAKKVGILYTSSEDNSYLQAQDAEKELKAQGLEPITMTITSTNDIRQNATTLASQVDAIYVPADNTIAGAMPTLIEITDAAQIPVFPAVESMVEDGGLATIGLNQYELGILTGRMTAKMIKGELKPATTPIEYLKQGTIVLNQKQAKKLGIKIPQEIIEKIERSAD